LQGAQKDDARCDIAHVQYARIVYDSDYLHASVMGKSGDIDPHSSEKAVGHQLVCERSRNHRNWRCSGIVAPSEVAAGQ
jgi:hypothetical protein